MPTLPVQVRAPRRYSELTIARRHPRLYSRLTWATAEAIVRMQHRKDTMARLPR